MAPPEMESKRKSRAATEESLQLPEEILEEILVRLAVKSLSRFRCVSKSWLSLINSKRFIKRHLQYSTEISDSARHRVIFTNGGRKSKQYSLRELLEEPAGALPSPLGHRILLKLDSIVCCCNGLLCIYQRHPRRRFLLLNPTTRVSKKLPKDPEIDYSDTSLSLRKFGFGWDESSGAYKVFAGWSKSRVYSSKTNSWKTVKDPYLRCSRVREGKLGKFVGGKLHWLSKRGTIISSFDLESEVFGTIELPCKADEGRFGNKLGVVGGCLCLSRVNFDDGKKFFNVWVMKQSWEKLATIHLVPLVQLLGADLIGDAANGEILIAYGSSLLVYCPRNGEIRNCREIGCVYKGLLYVESLVSPVREIASSDI